MKLLKNIAIIILLLALLPLSSMAGREKPKKKLSAGAYLSTVKIEIVSGDHKRFKTAIKYLEDLVYWSGPHAEALFWMNQIEVDYIETTADPVLKRPHIERFVAYVDSLEICCDKDNEDVKKKYKKKCDEYVEKSDSLIIKFWRDFYNNGINLMNDNLAPIQEDIKLETDSAVIERFKEDLQANVDSIVANFELCLILDKTDVRAYNAFGALYDKLELPEKSIEWRVKGLEFTEDKVSMLQTIAYNYIALGDYGGAIPYMRDYLVLAPEDLLTLGNLAICFNNQKMLDSSFAVYLRILDVDSTNSDALSSIGHYYRQRSQAAADSARAYQEADNETAKKEWSATKEAYVDSFLVYYKRVLLTNPENEQVQFLYATYNYFRHNWEIAITGFSAATELNPSEKDYWRYLGDAYIQTKDFTNSAASYEKYIAIDATDKAVWEQLVSLYAELKKPADKARAQKELDALK